MEFGWELPKAEANFKKHGVRFPESLPVFEDHFAITITDDESDPGEQRFVSIGVRVQGRVRSSSIPIVKPAFALFQRGRPSRARSGNTRRTGETRI
jgi:uncharacterized DUF497 family protein